MSMVAEALKTFKVGGHEGWLEPGTGNSSFYVDWASSHRFHVGDSLNFEYKEDDSVMVVDKWSYYHCDAANPIEEFTDGNSTFVLDRPGPFFFISGAENHCRNGQRLLVEVIHPKSPPAFANPPEGGYNPLSPASASPTSGARVPIPVSLALSIALGGACVVGAMSI
ncbi:hypothetical protein MLD38_004869 [Melastoma candidum]|uniref:Uncharacterized protein n=1 Tax=Melastoma candidum TaxID=119954 RepID=A0ACB9S6L2_9MYRT|nr:hypothetical protein MLD38_004869 [Melastoma candidum]